MTLFQRYAAQAERSCYKAYREFAAARKSRNEVHLVTAPDAGIARRILGAPLLCQPPRPPVQDKPNPPTAAAAPSLRSNLPENLALRL